MTEAIEVGWFGPADGCWTWVQNHFHCVRALEEDELAGWLEPTKARNNVLPRVLFAVLDHRSDRRIQVVHRVLDASPSGSSNDTNHVACLLGSDWQGHRRTHPLPERFESFYWFQVADRILPWAIRHAVVERTEFERPRRRSQPKSQLPTPSNPRIQRILDQSQWCHERLAWLASQSLMTWVITDNAQQRNLWMEILDGLQVRCVSSRFEDSEPWCHPELIVVDCVSRVSDSMESMRQRIVEVRQNHPQAFLALVDPFPIWDRWQSWIQCGVDALLPRPLQVGGFLVVWQHWLQQRALSRDLS